MDETPYAVWTRYETPTGRIIRHAFGPYPRNKALAERRRMLREAEKRDSLDKVEISAVQLIGDEDE
jgi:hypothetical protein